MPGVSTQEKLEKLGGVVSKVLTSYSRAEKAKPNKQPLDLELQTTSFLQLFQLDDSKSLHTKWLFHQTSIWNRLFRVPGTYKEGITPTLHSYICTIVREIPEIYQIPETKIPIITNPKNPLVCQSFSDPGLPLAYIPILLFGWDWVPPKHPKIDREGWGDS